MALFFESLVWRLTWDRYLAQNMDWLEEELGGFENDYLIIDCPGNASFRPNKSRTLTLERRSNRALHSSSVLALTGKESESDGDEDMCFIPH